MSELMLINPRKRKRVRKHKAKRVKHRAKRTFRRKTAGKVITLKRKRTYMTNPKRRRYRKNPMSVGGFKPANFIKGTFMPAAVGAAGALGLDMLLGFMPLPAAMKTPMMRPVIRIVGAVGIGMLAGMVTNKRIGEQVGAGALTVVLYDTLKGFVQTQFPTVNLSGMEEYPSMEYLTSAPQVDGYVDEIPGMTSDMGEYVMGEYVPG